MARLSSPESAMQKLEEIYDKLEEFFEIVNTAQEVKEKISAAYTDIKADESVIHDKISLFDNRGEEQQTAINGLKAMAEKSQQQTQQLILAFEDEKSRIDEALARLFSEQLDIEALRKILDDEQAKIKADIENKTAYFVNLSDSSLGNARILITQAVVEGRQIIENVIETAREDLKSFRKHVNQYLNEKIDELAAKLAGFQTAAEKELLRKFDEETKGVQSVVSQEIKSLHHNYQTIKTRFDESMHLLQTEREDIMGRRRTLEQEMARANEEFSTKNELFTARTDKLIAASKAQIDQSIENGNHLLEEEVNHVHDFISGSEQELGNLKSDLVGFKGRMEVFLTDEVKEMYKQLSDFHGIIHHELTDKFTAESGQLRDAWKSELQAIVSDINREKVKINETLQGLKSDKKNIEETRRQFETEVQQINRKISEKTALFTNQQKKLILSSQQKITQATQEANNQVDAKLKQFSTLLETSKVEMRKFKTDFESFKKETDEWMKQKAIQFTKQQSGFQQAALSKVTSKLSEEAVKIRKATEDEVSKKMDDYINRQKTLVDTLIQQIDSFDRRVSVIKTEHGEAILEHRQKDARISSFVENLTKKQSEQETYMPEVVKRLKAVETRFKDMEKIDADMRQVQDRQEVKIPDLEKRLKGLEQKIEEMMQKRGLFSFAKP